VDELHFDTLNGAIINRVPAGKAALLRGKITQVGTHPLTIICDGGLSTDGARIDGTDVEIDASKMTMQNSGITASRVQIRVGESEESAGTYHLRSTSPLYLSNTFIRAQEVRSMSGAICLLKDSELSADHINLSIGADIRISYGAEGTETQEEISVTRDNTLSLWNSSVSGGDISFPPGGGGEPLLHAAFIRALAPHVQLPIYLETNGTLHEELKKCIDCVAGISMDIKLPSATTHPVWDAHVRFLEIAKAKDTWVKIVVAAESPDSEVDTAIRLVADTAPESMLILQPVTPYGGCTKPSPEQLLAWQENALRRLAHVRVIPQTHRMMDML